MTPHPLYPNNAAVHDHLVNFLDQSHSIVYKKITLITLKNTHVAYKGRPKKIRHRTNSQQLCEVLYLYLALIIACIVQNMATSI